MSGKPFTYYRNNDLKRVLDLLANDQCAAVIGLSNFGKSALLRALQAPDVAQHLQARVGALPLFVYVDCNRMLELSPRGFYEATLRAALETLAAAGDPLRVQVDAQYRIVVAPPNDFAVPLAFNDALVTLVESGGRRVVLLLDEFDQVLDGIETRVLLNLRALRDRYGAALSYVTATVSPLTQGRQDDDVAEFAELFDAGKVFLGPLSAQETRSMAAALFAAAGDTLDEPESAFVAAQAGGHPGLIQAVVRTLLQVESGAPGHFQQQAFDLVNAALEHDRLIGNELARLWAQLSAEEQHAVIDLVTVDHLSEEQCRLLEQRGLLRPPADGVDSPQLFSQLFARFARRQALHRRERPSGVWIDTDSGEVWVDGYAVPTLTDLEYRLLLLLYGRLDKLCDKFQLVEAVWGQEYIDDVDDARIEKLVSRLRAKLEDHPGAVRYLVTLRGRGYRLSSTPEAIS